MALALFSKRIRQPAPPVVESKHLPQDVELIRSRSQTVALLNQLRNSHSLLTVEFPGSLEDFTTTLIALDSGRDVLHLDELTPDEGNALFEKYGYCYVSTHLRGVFIGFIAELICSTQDHRPLYEVQLPEVVDYAQRREHHRVEVPGSDPLPVLLLTEEQVRLSGVVRDISEAGVSAFLYQAPDTLDAGTVLPRCSVELPGHRKVLSQLILTYVDRRHKHRRVRIGGRFVGLEQADQRALQRMVMEFDRLIRKGAIRQ